MLLTSFHFIFFHSFSQRVNDVNATAPNNKLNVKILKHSKCFGRILVVKTLKSRMFWEYLSNHSSWNGWYQRAHIITFVLWGEYKPSKHIPTGRKEITTLPPFLNAQLTLWMMRERDGPGKGQITNGHPIDLPSNSQRIGYLTPHINDSGNVFEDHSHQSADSDLYSASEL